MNPSPESAADRIFFIPRMQEHLLMNGEFFWPPMEKLLWPKKNIRLGRLRFEICSSQRLMKFASTYFGISGRLAKSIRLRARAL